MKVLVIPEDFRKDQFILQPLVEAMLKQLGVSKPKVAVCRDPLLGGVGQALKRERIAEILEQYKGMVTLFLLCVDRDGVAGRRAALDAIEAASHAALGEGKLLLGENAWQELEVWLLAAMTDWPTDWKWADIRSETHPKETYYLPYAVRRGVVEGPGEGRQALGREAASNYRRVSQLCPEDVAALERRIKDWIEAGKTGGPPPHPLNPNTTAG